MKIRHRITLWASLAGLVASVVLSAMVFFWGLESPYEFLDQELEIRARTLVEEFARERSVRVPESDTTMERFAHLYWAKIYDLQGRQLFASAMARAITLPMRPGSTGYLIATDIPLNRFYSDEDDEPTAFWNRVFTVPVGENSYQVHVARPVESLIGESIESAAIIALALLAATSILIAVSYLVAGRILRPVQEINRLTSEITEKTLEKRIPLSGNNDEIDALVGSLNAMFNRLQYSFLRQKEFLANASHELKTPLTLLRLSVEEILQEPDLSPALQDKLLAQERTLSRMGLLVKSLLDLSRLELSDTLDRTPVQLTALVTAVAQEFEGLLQEESLGLSTDLAGPLPLLADPEMLRRVLINLLDNAIRYNQPGGTIHCRAYAEGMEAILEVSNTGPGIGPEDLGRVFDQFYRCEKSRSVARGGSGLGLTIVKRIVTLHGGRVEVASETRGTTTFRVILPLCHCAEGAG